MAVRTLVFIPAKQAENTQTTQYTAVNCYAVIDKFTVTNTHTDNVLFSAHIVSSGGTANDTNVIIDARAIAPNETYTCPELIGQVLENDAFISTLAGTASALTIRASGRQIT